MTLLFSNTSNTSVINVALWLLTSTLESCDLTSCFKTSLECVSNSTGHRRIIDKLLQWGLVKCNEHWRIIIMLGGIRDKWRVNPKRVCPQSSLRYQVRDSVACWVLGELCENFGRWGSAVLRNHGRRWPSLAVNRKQSHDYANKADFDAKCPRLVTNVHGSWKGNTP